MNLHIDQTTLNTFGLLLDIIGTIILFKFGLPENLSREGKVYLILEGPDLKEKEKARMYDRWGKAGLILLILGFVLQALANYI